MKIIKKENIKMIENIYELIDENGKLKDEVIINALGMNNNVELKHEAAGIFDKIAEDKINIEKNIIYILANLETTISIYQELQYQFNENNAANLELAENTIDELLKDLESSQDDLRIIDKSTSIIARYINEY
jgi:hypothetical protein